jgi:CheY-like chemotaxis protein
MVSAGATSARREHGQADAETLTFKSAFPDVRFHPGPNINRQSLGTFAQTTTAPEHSTARFSPALMARLLQPAGSRGGADIRTQICLVGAGLCRNWSLIQRLAGRHGLTLLRRAGKIDHRLLAAFDLIAIDCRERGSLGSRELVGTLRKTTRVPIVVLDGGLGVREVARLLKAGAQDYFSEPFDVKLIAERLAHLANSYHRHTSMHLEARR